MEDNDALEGFESPSYNGSKFEQFSVKDGSTLYRVLPGIKSLAKRKEWHCYWATHFWMGKDARNPDKDRVHPILCVEERDWARGGMITQECPLCQKREEVKKKIAAIEAAGLSRGMPKSKIAAATADLQKWMKNHGRDGKYRVYAINENEQVGILKLATTAMRALKEKINKLVSRNHDPLGRKGVWFEFSRTGTGFSTNYSVEPATYEQESGAVMLRFHELKKNLWQTALEVLPDMEDEKKRISYPLETLVRLAENGDDPAAVNEILGIRNQTESGYSDSNPESGAQNVPDEDFGDFGTSAEAPPAGKPAAAPAAPATPAAASKPTPTPEKEPTQEDEDAEMEAEIAAIRARKAAARAGVKNESKPAPKVDSAADLAADADDDLDSIFKDKSTK
jgi:hypothetical protein